MTAYICISLVVIELILLSGSQKVALIVALCFIAGGFGYRLYSGEEVRAVVADVLFVVTSVLIGWWAAKQWLKLTDSSQSTNDN